MYIITYTHFFTFIKRLNQNRYSGNLPFYVSQVTVVSFFNFFQLINSYFGHQKQHVCSFLDSSYLEELRPNTTFFVLGSCGSWPCKVAFHPFSVIQTNTNGYYFESYFQSQSNWPQLGTTLLVTKMIQKGYLLIFWNFKVFKSYE